MIYCRTSRGDIPIRQSQGVGLKNREWGGEMKGGGRGDQDEKGREAVEVSTKDEEVGGW